MIAFRYRLQHWGEVAAALLLGIDNLLGDTYDMEDDGKNAVVMEETSADMDCTYLKCIAHLVDGYGKNRWATLSEIELGGPARNRHSTNTTHPTE